MSSEIISVLCGGLGPSWPEVARHSKCTYHPIDNRDNHLTPCQAYQEGLEKSDPDTKLLIYIHDDVTIHGPSNWHTLVWLDAFLTSPDTVAVGFGGATSLGHPDLYKRPYRLEDMARGGYMSNQTDAEVHGAREKGFKQVVVLDAFFMAVRKDFLLSIGGWPVEHLSHHCLDLWLACEAARAGKQTWMAGIDCTHHGGGTSIKSIYANAKWLQGGTLDSDHQTPHRWLYETYRDVLPLSL